MENYAIILASGNGIRFKNDIPKQFFKINGKTILEYSLDAFEKNENISKIILVITPEYKAMAEEIIKNNYKKLAKIINGGETRKDSSYNGVMAVNSIAKGEVNVLIHDCARPLVSQRIINDCITALQKYDAVDVAIPSSDTVIEVDNNIVKKIPSRKVLRRVQTPQCFKLSVIKKAHEMAKDDKDFTDDCGMVVKYGLCEVFVVEGDVNNIKITYPDDIYIAEKVISKIDF